MKDSLNRKKKIFTLLILVAILNRASELKLMIPIGYILNIILPQTLAGTLLGLLIFTIDIMALFSIIEIIIISKKLKKLNKNE